MAMSTCMLRTLAVTLGLCLGAASFTVRADVQRIAIFIGEDNGLEGDRPLHYASRDAREMADAFRFAKSVDEDRIYLLVNVSMDKIRAAMEEVRGRVRELHKSGTESMVLLYYSGHGGAEGLHVQGRNFPREELAQYVDSLQSNLKVVILDACESGDFLRQKGGHIVEGPKVVKLDKLSGKGTIFISSSSRGEMAQESEDYRGAVFTHHFLNGMRGLADYDGDKTIRLLEAFDYARVSTKREEIMGQIGQQNPEFDFDLTGESDPVVAQLGSQQSRLLLDHMPAGPLEIFNGSTLNLESKVWLTGQDSVSFYLPSDKYILAYRDKDASRVLQVDMTWKRQETVRPEAFRRKAKSLLYGKGGKSLDLDFHGMQYSLRRISPFGSAPLNQVGYVYRGYWTKQTLGLSFASTFLDGGPAGLSNSLRIFGVGYSTEVPLWHSMYGQILAGGAASWHYVEQRIRDTRFGDSPVEANGVTVGPDRESQANLYRAAVPLECEVYFPFRMWLSASVEGAGYLYHGGADGSLQTKFALEPGLAIGHQF
jgi:hypothetical protein